MEKYLELRQISKSYSGVEVLHEINLDLYPGEVLCLVGENGAGKSTLIKVISGAIHADSGTICYFGKQYAKPSPSEVMKLGIATIYQDVDLVDNLTVADNIFLGQELRNRFGLVDIPKQVEQSKELFMTWGLDADLAECMMGELSTAQKQCVQIVRALKNDAKILILDEPTASLGDKETKLLLDLVRTLKNKGIAMIYISHFIQELFQVGDKMLVLKDGVQVSMRVASDTTQEQLIRDMIGREASSYFHREYFERGKHTLAVEHYEKASVVKDVSLELYSGEIYGLGGLVGAGRTELAQLICGIEKKKRGALFLDGKEITPKSPRDAIDKGIYMISEDRKAEGLFGQRSVKENITITHNEQKEWIHLQKESELVGELIDTFSIKTADQETEIVRLSGGNQQKAIIARSVIDTGMVYIFDEPTKGVDVGAKEEIYKKIIELAKQDKFILLISSDMPELLSMSDRIGIMCEGEFVKTVLAHEATEESLMRSYLGVS
jgi:ribose transport system ATP-binding protein